MKVLKRFTLILSLLLFSSLLYAQTDSWDKRDAKWLYKNGLGDGYAETAPTSYISKLIHDQYICEGSTAHMRIIMTEGGLFAYGWREAKADATTLSTNSYYLIPGCGLGYNGKKFVCDITDLRNMQVMVSDTVVLNVVAIPKVKLNLTRDTTLCYGEQLQLEMVGPKNGDVYNWSGEGIVGATNVEYVTVRPEKSVKYILTVNNGGCSDSTTLRVNVVKQSVKLPKLVVLEKNQELVLAPAKTVGSKLNWEAAGTSYANKDTLKIADVAQNMIVRVKSEQGRCVVEDSTQVYAEQAFARFAGGEEDGFAHSKQKMVISGITYTDQVCKGESARFMLNIQINSSYEFIWRKVGSDDPLPGGDSKLFIIENCTEANSGQYYCECVDVDTKEKIVSDPVTLTVLSVPSISIVSPTQDTTICFGEKLTLKSEAQLEANGHIMWAGSGIQGDPTVSDVTVLPTEDSVIYQVFANHGVCRSSAQRVIRVKKNELQIPAVLHYTKGDPALTINAEVGPGDKFAWKMDGFVDQHTPFTFTPTKSTTVTVTKYWNNRCPVYDTCQVYFKDFDIAGDYTGDGYSEQNLSFSLSPINSVPKVCRFEKAEFSLDVTGFGIYRYQWKLIHGGVVEKMDTLRKLEISSALDDHSGKYFCEVTEVESGITRNSDTVEFSVLPKPEAVMDYPEDGVDICYGSIIELAAMTKSGVTYLWSGLGIQGAADSRVVKVKPEETTTYSVIVSNGYCFDQAFVGVVVKKPELVLPDVVQAVSDEIVTIDPKVSSSATVEWAYGNGVENTRIFNKNLKESTLIHVTLEDNDCVISDSVQVFIKQALAYRGGMDDGFYESDKSFKILGVDYEPIICENTSVDFTIRVSGSGLFSYTWKRVGNDDVLGTDRILTLTDLNMNLMDASIYCQVTDLQRGETLSSDPKVLTVKRGPKAVIGSPERNKLFCNGETITLDARKTEESKLSPSDEFVYYWEGENIKSTDRPYIVQVTPTETQVYTLRVDFFGCVDNDTMTIRISKPKVDVPTKQYIRSGETATVQAVVSQVSLGATVGWMNEGLFTPNVNPFVVPNVQKSTVVTAIVRETNGCESKDSTLIYVRANNTYRGGEDDGFMESCEVPVIETGSDQLLGCGGNDSVALVVNYTGDVETFNWQKYNDVSGEYEAVAEAENRFGLGTETLIMKPIKEVDLGIYRCVLNNSCGFVSTKAYVVSNGQRPQIEENNPANKQVTYCVGTQNVQLSIPIKGDSDNAEIRYRWYKKNATTGAVAQLLPEAKYNQKYLNFLELKKADEAMYLAEAENSCGVTKDSVRLFVTDNIVITQQPHDTTVCVNSQVRLWCLTYGGTMQSYQLQRVEKDAGAPGGYRVLKTYDSQSANNYAFAAITHDEAGNYVWKVSADCGGSVTSQMFHITVENPPVFNFVSNDTLVCSNTLVKLKVEVEAPGSNGANIKYRWMRDNASLAEASSTISFTANDLNLGNYLCYAKNSCPEVAAPRSIKVGLRTVPLIVENPILKEPSYCEDKVVTITAKAENLTEVSRVKWYRGNVAVSDEVNRISGSSTYTLKIDSLILSDAGSYRLSVFHTCGETQSRSVALVVDEKARIVKKIIDDPEFRQKVCQGEEKTLKITASGKAPLSYMWLVNNTKVDGADQSSLKVTFSEDAQYCANVINGCGGGFDCVNVEVIKADTFHVEGSGRYCKGDGGRKIWLAHSDTNYIYKLYKEGVAGVLAELKGKEAESIGGVINFGMHEKGIYYVMGKDQRTLCDFKMPGVAEIVEDTLPPIFNVFVQRPMCEGMVESADIALDGSINSRAIEYTLYKKNKNDWKIDKGLQKGTGDTLVWTDVDAGIFKVECKDYTTGCISTMNGMPEIKKRPMPTICNVTIVDNDSTYCKNSKSDVRVTLDKTCMEGSISYTLKKNGKEVAVADSIDNSILGEWNHLPSGVYTIEAKNEWGCKSYTRPMTVIMDPLPNVYHMFGGKKFCDVDKNTTSVIQLEKGDSKVKYELFAAPKIKIDERIGEGKALSWDVPLVDSVYYVIATDPKTQCKVEMANRTEMSSSKLKLRHDPVFVDLGSTFMTQFNLQISGAEGTPRIKWTSDNELLDPTNVANPTVMFMDEPQVSLYHVEVSDALCTKKMDLEVIFTGEVLRAVIKNSNQTVIPNDTIAVCYGDQYKLYGSVQGGNGVYQLEWKWDGRQIGNEKLIEQTANKSGYIYFIAKSLGVTMTDSVWVNVIPAPNTDLRIVNDGVNCVAPGKNIELALANTEKGNSYSLQYSKTGAANTYKSNGISKTGDESGKLNLELAYADDKNGFYGVKVSKSYGSTMVCSALYTGIEVRRGTVKADIGGGGVYCNKVGISDTIRVDTTESGANYRLIGKHSGDTYFATLETKAGVDSILKFVGNYGDGEYYVVAERGNSCVDTMIGRVQIIHKPKPHVGPMINSGDYCKKSGESVNVIMGVEDCAAGVTYRLFREEPHGVFVQLGDDHQGFGDWTFGTYGDNGRYVVVADDGYCQDTSWQIRIAAPPVAVDVVAVDTSYCQLDNSWEIQAKAFKVNHLIDYKIYSAETMDSVGIFRHFNQDTVYYKGQLNEGKYIVKGVIGSCSVDMPTPLKVKAFPEPARKSLVRPLIGCDNVPLAVGVLSAQDQVSYQIYKKGEKENVKVGTALVGSGADLALGTLTDRGTYYIEATNVVTGCRQVMDSLYQMNQAPKLFNIIAEDTVFCQSPDPKVPGGTRIGLSGVEAGIRYYLQKYDAVKSAFVDVQDSIVPQISSSNKWWFISPSYGAGKYRVRTNKCNGSLMAGELEVIEIGVPADLKLNLLGNGCVGTNLQLVLNPTEVDVTYSLYKDNVSIGDKYLDLKGNGGAMAWTFVTAEKGNYTIKINKSGCETLIDTIIRVDDVPLLGNLQGVASICQYADTALYLTDWERVASYRLYSHDGDLVAKGVESNGRQVFRPVPVGTYYAVANRGNCEKKSTEFVVGAIASPDVHLVDVTISECAEIGEGSIEIKGMESMKDYLLKYPGSSAPVYLSGTDKRLDKLALGDYYLRVQDKTTKCYSQYDTLRLRQSVPADKIAGNFAYCDAAENTRLTMSAVTKDIRYSVYSLATDGTTALKAELFNGSSKVFNGTFKEGKYIFVKKREGLYMPGCATRDTFDIKHYNSPSIQKKLEIVGGPELCAGGTYEVVVKNTDADVQYILMHDVVPVDTVWGPGDKKFKAVGDAGTYRILPKTGGACGDTYIDSIVFVNSGPKSVDVQACSYCYETGAVEEGCSIRLLGSYSSVKYILMKEGTTIGLDTINGVSYESANFKRFTVGKYNIKAIDTLTHCTANMSSVEITKGIAPKKFDLGLNGVLCGSNIEITTNNGSEGDSVQYFMYKDNQVVSEALTRNDGQNISFGVQHDVGVYKIYAYKPKYDCGVFMNDSLVILKGVNIDTLQLRGVYCTNETDKIKLRMGNSVPNWKYYLTKEVKGQLVCSDTMSGSGQSLIWSRIWVDGKKQPLDSGVYKLYATNACATPLYLDSIVVAANEPPLRSTIVGGDKKLCVGNKHEIILQNSQTGVVYALTGKASANIVGTGSALSFGKTFTEAGDYVVIGTDQTTGCTDTVARMKMTTATAPADPVVVGKDVCLGTDPVKELRVSLKDRDYEGIDYHLRYIKLVDNLLDTTVVDVLKAQVDVRDAFTAQTGVGRYEVVANNGACEKVFGDYRVGDMPAACSVLSATKSICKGNLFSVEMQRSEVGVQYELYRTTKVVDPDTMYMGLSAAGTGAGFIVGAVADSGTYLVRANNGCQLYMPGSVHLSVTTPYELDLGPGYTICKGDSVKINIYGRTNPVLTASYLLLAPGKTTGFTEMIRGSADQASLSSRNYYKTPGFYTVKNAAVYDGVSCMEIDSVELKVLDLPTVYTISNNSGDYICSGGAKEIVLSGNQLGVQYTLYRKDGDNLIPIDSKDGGQGQIKFTVNAPGSYVVEGGFLAAEPACKQRMNGVITLLELGTIKQIELKKIRDSYCFNVTPAGQVKLMSSENGVEYQLYKDGLAYGTPKPGNGSAIEWMNLPGGTPADARYPDRKIGFDYMVMARNLQTECQQEMVGHVVIVEERNVEFEASHFQNAITPCVGDPVMLDVKAWGGNLTYEWKQIPTGTTQLISRQKGTNSFLQIAGVQPSDYGFYRCVMSNSCSKDSTQLQEIKPKMLVEKESEMGDVAVCNLKDDETVVKTLKAAMRNASNYTWYKDGVEIAGAKTAYYDVQVSKKKGFGEYVCKAANDCGFLTDTVKVTIDSVPTIKAKLKLDTVCFATPDYVMNVTSNFPKQWYRGEKLLTGETGNTLTLASVKKEDEGIYYVISENGCGTAKAEVVKLLVDDTIKVIGNSLDDQKICGSTRLDLSIATSPDATRRVVYKWEDAKGKVLGNKSGLDGFDVSPYIGKETYFRVHYSNKCSDGYKDFKVDVVHPIEINRGVTPDQILLCSSPGAVADTALWLAHAEGMKATYQWFRLKQNSDKPEVVGNTDTIRIDILTKNTGAYYCKVSNICGDSTSRQIWVRVDTIPEILSVLRDTTVCAQTPLTLRLSAQGGGLAYSWKVLKNVAGALPETVQSLGDSVVFRALTEAYNGAKVWCEVSNACQMLKSNEITLTILPMIKMTVTPTTATACEGDSAIIRVALTSGELPWSYSYKFQGVEKNRMKISKLIDTLKVTDVGLYDFVYMKDNRGCINMGKLGSSTVTLNKVATASMTLDGKNLICANDSVNFKIHVSGTTVGPWMVAVHRQSDGMVATESGFSESILIDKRDTVITVRPQRTETYFAVVQDVYEAGLCQAKMSTLPIYIEVKTPAHITATIPDKRTFGRCDKIDLNALFNAQPAGGEYMVGLKQVPGGWLEPDKKVNDYTISYRVWESGCETRKDLTTLTLTKVPEVTLTCEHDNLCPGMASNVTIKAKGEYPLNLTYAISYLNPNKTKDTKTYTKKITGNSDNEVNIVENAVYRDKYVGVIYQVTRLEDPAVCTAELDETHADTIWFRPEPQVTLLARSSNMYGGEWDDVNNKFVIATGDSVELKATLDKGGMPWNIYINSVLNPADAFQFYKVPVNNKQFSIKKDGFYNIVTEDAYGCVTGGKHYDVKVADTAYLSLKALLEGPYDVSAYKMRSGVLSLISKKDLEAEGWPNVGSKKIIDWINVELWQPKANPVGRDSLELWNQQLCLLLDDGTIVNKQGKDLLPIASGVVRDRKFHVALRHRNHLAVMSKLVSLENATKTTPLTLDFTKSTTICVPDGVSIGKLMTQVNLSGGYKGFALSAGDYNLNGLITVLESNQNALNLSISTTSNATTSKYIDLDVNFDGNIDWPGFGGVKTGRDDWAIVYGNLDKYSIVPDLE